MPNRRSVYPSTCSMSASTANSRRTSAILSGRGAFDACANARDHLGRSSLGEITPLGRSRALLPEVARVDKPLFVGFRALTERLDPGGQDVLDAWIVSGRDFRLREARHGLR